MSLFFTSASILLCLESLLVVSACGPYLAFTLLSVVCRLRLTSASCCKWQEMTVAESSRAEEHRSGEMGGEKKYSFIWHHTFKGDLRAILIRSFIMSSKSLALCKEYNNTEQFLI